MQSDSIAGFLYRAQASRVLFPDQIEQLIRQPDIPHSNLDSLCQYLEERGTLTHFQANAIRTGRGEDLSFASYPIIDEIGPCPGGIAYRALHPSLRTPIELRRFKPEALYPSDSPAALLQRAQTAAGLHHANLVTLLDAGQQGDEIYAVIERPVDSGPLDALVRDIGPMPGYLAAEFGRQTADALRAAHERGLVHGDIRPVNLLVGPMMTKAGPDGTMKRRPAPNAAVKLAELGLVPRRPAAALSTPPLEVLPYLPPERLERDAYEPSDDLYSLGATLYHLLTGRPPFAGNTSTELLPRIRNSEPPPLAALRPDIPADFSALVHQLLRKQPGGRPATAFEVEQSLLAFCRPGSIPMAAPATGPVAMTAAQVLAEDVPAADPMPSSADEWGAGDSFSTSHASAAPLPQRRLSAKEKARTKMLVVLGLCLHLSATALIVAWLLGVFDSAPESNTVQPTKQQKEPFKKKTKAHS